MKAVALWLTIGALTVAAPPTVSREQAHSFQKKLGQIVQHAETPAKKPRQTTVSEAEVNSYLRYNAGDKLPVGVTDPSVGIQGRGRVNGRAVVDLDRIRQKRGSGGWFDPLSYVTGKVPLTAAGVLETHAGKGKFTLESAEVSGVPIPKYFLQEIVTYYTRTPEFPNGINIDDPFTLPAAIQKIDVQPGRATIIQ